MGEKMAAFGALIGVKQPIYRFPVIRKQVGSTSIP